MKHLIPISLLLFSLNMYSQEKEIIYLWPEIVPGEPKAKQPAVFEERKDDILMYTEVTNPALEVFLPDPAVSNGSAVIICPGGGYHILAYDKEGSEIAEWLNKLGFTAFVLQYRIPDKREGALQDVQRAFRIVRRDAKKWNIDPDKIGVMGFSAGGSLSARASTHFNTITYSPVDKADSLSCRPDFTVLIYPAYLDEGPGHTLTPELKLVKEVPPVFIFQTADDEYGNSALVIAGALRDAELSVELHILSVGGHGYGLRPGSIAASTWPELAGIWLSTVLQDKK